MWEIPAPAPGAGQVVVEAKAASVDFVDTLIATGRYQVPLPVPFTPGNNLAGVVREAGPDCRRFTVGDRVHGMAFVGAFAERAAVDETRLRPTPDDLSYEYACVTGSTYRTAYDALVTTAALKPGENLVILGASGAVGSAGIAIGKTLGARVIACASTAAKLDFCREQGANEAVAYTEAGFKDTLKDLGGADVVLDMVGGDWSEPALRATGRLTPPITRRYRLGQAVEAMRSVAGRDKYGITILDLT